MINKHRIFVGLDLSGYLLNTIPMIRSTIPDKKQFINWVSGRNLHLTLSFLGGIELEKITVLKEELRKISKGQSFEITINSTGSFSYKENRKVLWLGIDKGRTELVNIQSNIESITSSFKDSDIIEEEFIPHITIGRIKSSSKNFDLSTFSNAVYSDIKIPIKKVYLFKSQMSEKGVEYSIISEYSLK